jgi:hypothetical protein
MSLRNFTKLGLAVLVVSGLLSWTTASAWTCTGTLTLASSDDGIGPGQTCGGDYTNTHASDDSDQCLQETLQGGVSHLGKAWRFANVPAGAQSFIWEGHRPGNADGDNFKINAAWIDEDGPHFLLTPSATIDKNFEVVGGTKVSLGHTSLDTFDWTLNIKDTAGGTNLDTVYIDYLAFCTE